MLLPKPQSVIERHSSAMYFLLLYFDLDSAVIMQMKFKPSGKIFLVKQEPDTPLCLYDFNCLLQNATRKTKILICGVFGACNTIDNTENHMAVLRTQSNCL